MVDYIVYTLNIYPIVAIDWGKKEYVKEEKVKTISVDRMNLKIVKKEIYYLKIQFNKELKLRSQAN